MRYESARSLPWDFHSSTRIRVLTISPQSQALLNAIKEYENNKWKTIGQKVGKPAKACEQYAKEHFPGKELYTRSYQTIQSSRKAVASHKRKSKI